MIYHSSIRTSGRSHSSRLMTTLVASASGMAMMLAASSAYAQAPTTPPTTDTTVATPPSAQVDSGSEEAQDIVVTGSRITAAGFDAPTPTTVIGADLIAKAAQPNIFNAITQLPSLQGSTGTTVANGNTSTGATGLSGLNLRGLGTFRTLTLLDGQRVVASNISNITDISQFPQLLIERVEVVTGGASASYGSDAVAGVVNFITNKKFEGFKANVQGGITTYGDDAQGNFQAAYGTSFLDGKLHVIASGEYYHSDGIIPGGKFGGLPVNGRKRLPRTGAPSYSIAGTPAGSPQTTYYLDNAQTIIQAPNGLITSGPLQGTLFGAGGTTTQLVYGGSGIPNRTAAGGVVGCIQTTCLGGASYGPLSTAGGDNAIDAKIDRIVGYGRISYDLTDNFEIFGSVNLAQVKTITQPTQGIPQNGLTGQCDNAFLNASVKAACAAANITSFTFGTIGENLPHYLDVHNDRRQKRFVVGANGKFDAFGSTWSLDSYFEHGRTSTRINVRNNVLRALYNNATDAIVVGGQIVCRNVVARANGCIPYNGFGDVENSEAAFRYFAPASGSTSYSKQRQEAASIAINGTPFQNWAGDVSVAFGAEWREEAYRVTGDPYGAGIANSPFNEQYPANPLLATTGSNWFAGNFANGNGKYNVKDFFFETGIPIFDSKAAGKLSFNGAVRATEYSTSGWVATWKLGGTYDTPVEGLRLRAVRSRDIRAPNLSDLFAAPVSVNSTFNDRFNGDKVVAAQQRTVGNPNLSPEIASNLEAGIVYSPAFVPGLRLSFDYFKIDLKDAIQVLGGQQIVDLCFQGNAAFCGTDNFFLQGVQGSNNQSYVTVRPFNVASVKTKGFDIEASYRFNLDSLGVPGNFTVRGLATHTLDFTVDPGVVGQAIAQYAGNNSANNPAPGANGIAKWKAFVQQSWELGKFQFTATERIVSSGKINALALVCQIGTCPAPTVQVPTANYNKIPGQTLIDLGVNYEVSEPISVFAKVDNVTNKLAPPFGSPTIYDTIGRRFSIGARFNY
jgi:iron complex outermembrane receptor protein